MQQSHMCSVSVFVSLVCVHGRAVNTWVGGWERGGRRGEEEEGGGGVCGCVSRSKTLTAPRDRVGDCVGRCNRRRDPLVSLGCGDNRHSAKKASTQTAAKSRNIGSNSSLRLRGRFPLITSCFRCLKLHRPCPPEKLCRRQASVTHFSRSQPCTFSPSLSEPAVRLRSHLRRRPPCRISEP